MGKKKKRTLRSPNDFQFCVKKKHVFFWRGGSFYVPSFFLFFFFPFFFIFFFLFSFFFFFDKKKYETGKSILWNWKLEVLIVIDKGWVSRGGWGVWPPGEPGLIWSRKWEVPVVSKLGSRTKGRELHLALMKGVNTEINRQRWKEGRNKKGGMKENRKIKIK